MNGRHGRHKMASSVRAVHLTTQQQLQRLQQQHLQHPSSSMGGRWMIVGVSGCCWSRTLPGTAPPALPAAPLSPLGLWVLWVSDFAACVGCCPSLSTLPSTTPRRAMCTAEPFLVISLSVITRSPSPSIPILRVTYLVSPCSLFVKKQTTWYILLVACRFLGDHSTRELGLSCTQLK